MVQALVAEHDTEHPQEQIQPLSVGDLDAPRITLLGSLDADRGTDEMGFVETPIMKILYSGV